jgi:hypothetical protein
MIFRSSFAVHIQVAARREGHLIRSATERPQQSAFHMLAWHRDSIQGKIQIAVAAHPLIACSIAIRIFRSRRNLKVENRRKSPQHSRIAVNKHMLELLNY